MQLILGIVFINLDMFEFICAQVGIYASVIYFLHLKHILSFSWLDSSQDYTDSTGIDLHEFLVNTLKGNPRYA